MARIFISAGHSTNPRRDRGAAANGYVEGVLAAAFRRMVAASLKERYDIEAVVDDDDSILADTIRKFQRLTSPGCIALDIHFNSASPQATGTETFVPRNSDAIERTIAHRISVATAEILRIQLRGEHQGLRGVKNELESHHGARGLGFLRLPGHAILTEICFLTNKYDMAGYEAFKERLAHAYADILQEYVFFKTYIVMPGDTLWRIAVKHRTTVEAIQNINQLKGTSLRIGQAIKIRP